MQRQLRLTLVTLLIAACIGCDGGGDGDDDGNGSYEYAVFATLGGIEIDSDVEFRSNDVLMNPVSDFALGFTAVDGDYTIVFSIQNVEGEALSLGWHPMGADEASRVFASASVVIAGDGANTIFNANEEGGSVLLASFDATGATGALVFTASTLSDGSTITVEAAFGLVF